MSIFESQRVWVSRGLYVYIHLLILINAFLYSPYNVYHDLVVADRHSLLHSTVTFPHKAINRQEFQCVILINNLIEFVDFTGIILDEKSKEVKKK